MLLQLSVFIAFLVAVKYASGSGKKQLPHIESTVALEKDGPYHVFQGMRHAIRKKFKIATYPLLRKLGLEINMFLISDPNDVREVLKNDKVHGHEDVAQWWELLIQYRKLTNGYKADQINPEELGLMRDYDPTRPENTKIGKLIRRRIMDRLSKKALEPTWVAWVDEQRNLVKDSFLKLGENGTVAFNPVTPLTHPTLSNMLQFSLGHDLDHDRMEELVYLMDDGVSSILCLDNKKLIFMLIPRFIRGFIPIRFWPKFCKTQQRMYDLVTEMIEEHNSMWKVGEEVQSLIGVLEEDRHAGRITESDVIHTLHVLLIAGADTLATGITSIMLNFARFPEVQQKCYDELKSRNFQSQNLTDCPYLLATLWESMRYTTTSYRTMMHVVTEPLDVLGHAFKKGDFIVGSLTGIHTAEKYFKDPYKFIPERFLVDGAYRKDNNLMPFSVGKRSCPGQILAVIMFYHYTKNILRSFEVQMDPNIPLENDSTEESFDAFFSQVDHGGYHGHLFLPKESRVRFVPRKH